MGKFKLVFDSTVYLNQEILDANKVSVASLNVIEGDNSYREVDVTPQFIFDEQDKGASWTTSQPAPGEFLEIYETAIKEGYEKIFVCGLSKDISGTYQSANLAKNMLDNSDLVHIFDTQLCAYGSEMIAIELIDFVNQGLSAEVIIDRVTTLIKQSGQMFTVENLFALVKGGRITTTAAAIGTVLRMKPIIKVIDGKLQVVKKERTYKKVHKFLIDNMKESTEGYKQLNVYVTSHNSLDSAESIKSEILTYFPDAKITFTEYLGPVFSVHIGRKGYGISWCWE